MSENLSSLIIGIVVAFIAMSFLYQNMEDWQKPIFQKKSVMLELVFFFAPFGIAVMAQSTTAMVMSLGLGLGLSTFSYSIKQKIESEQKKKDKQLQNEYFKSMSFEERMKWIDSL